MMPLHLQATFIYSHYSNKYPASYQSDTSDCFIQVCKDIDNKVNNEPWDGHVLITLPKNKKNTSFVWNKQLWDTKIEQVLFFIIIIY